MRVWPVSSLARDRPQNGSQRLSLLCQSYWRQMIDPWLPHPSQNTVDTFERIIRLFFAEPGD